jgi:hypothetical protein
MRASIHGRVSATNLPKGKALLPLFEAVVNAHQAIEEAGGRNHSIRIVAERQGNLDDDKPGPIDAFTITDTGIGFTAANFESFNTVDSLYNANLGGSTDPTRNPSNHLRDFRRRALLDYALSACASFSQYSSTSGPRLPPGEATKRAQISACFQCPMLRILPVFTISRFHGRRHCGCARLSRALARRGLQNRRLNGIVRNPH